MSLAQFRRMSLVVALLLAGLALGGCALFEKSPSLLNARSFKIPSIALPPDAIVLDVVYVERPVGDLLLGPKLWYGVDEIAAVEPEHRAVIRTNGFRVGTVGSNPPPELQQMLGLKSEFAYEPKAEKLKQLVGHRYVVRSGAHQEIQASGMRPECSIETANGSDVKRRAFENALCKYRVTAERLQDGWVQLDFVPQIHHGQEQLRRDVGEGGWQFTPRQRTETMFPQRFSVRLSVGEMAVLTSTDDCDGKLGGLFFRGPSAMAPPEASGHQPDGEENSPNASDVQRLLIVRLATVNTPENK
ncbi:MAG: hypothetical protein ACKV0T_28125 [Planctomycetales bacterium]